MNICILQCDVGTTRGLLCNCWTHIPVMLLCRKRQFIGAIFTLGLIYYWYHGKQKFAVENDWVSCVHEPFMQAGSATAVALSTSILFVTSSHHVCHCQSLGHNQQLDYRLSTTHLLVVVLMPHTKLKSQLNETTRAHDRAGPLNTRHWKTQNKLYKYILLFWSWHLLTKLVKGRLAYCSL